jgi:hypothetical protein
MSLPGKQDHSYETTHNIALILVSPSHGKNSHKTGIRDYVEPSRRVACGPTKYGRSAHDQPPYEGGI